MVDRFWSDYQIEPKRKFRWQMGWNGIPYYLLKKASRPTINLTEAEHTFLNYKFYYPGRVEYDEMSVTVADPVHPDASMVMMELLRRSGYDSPDLIDLNKPKTLTKNQAVAAVGGKLFMQQLNGAGAVQEEWHFWNPWVKSVNFDEGDYESDDLINLEITFRYDWATLRGNKPNVPTGVGGNTSHTTNTAGLQGPHGASFAGPAAGNQAQRDSATRKMVRDGGKTA